HTHSHGESYVQDLDGMSGAIVIEGIERYVPEVAKMRERILMLRDLVLPDDPAERKTVMASVAMQTAHCGSAKEDPERAFTINGFVCCFAFALLRYRAGRGFQPRNGFGRCRFGEAIKSRSPACTRRITGLRNLFADHPQTRRSPRPTIRCYLH